MTQEEQVLRRLLNGDLITRLTMMQMGIGNGPNVIHRLRRRGVKIKTRDVSAYNAQGKKIFYGVYVLEDPRSASITLKNMYAERTVKMPVVSGWPLR